MIVGLFKGAGQIALWAATMAFLAGVSLLLFGSFLLTWPIMRKSPRDQKIKVIVDLATSGIAAMQVLGRDKVAELAAAYAEVEGVDNEEIDS